MKNEKKTDGISIEYVIKSLNADEEKDVVMVLEPTVKPKIPEKPKRMMAQLSEMMGADQEDLEKATKLGEGLLGEMLNMSSLYQITITSEQLKGLRKSIGDKVTVTVQ